MEAEQRRKYRIDIWRLNTALNKWSGLCGAWLLLILMFFITIDVTGRSTIDSPLPGSVEISITLMVFIIFLALASTEATGQHIRLTAISDRLGPRKAKYFNILAYVLGIVVTGIIVYLAWPWAWESWVNQDYIEGMLRVPYYPAKFVAAIGLTFLLLQFGLKLAKQVVKKEGSAA